MISDQTLEAFEDTLLGSFTELLTSENSDRLRLLLEHVLNLLMREERTEAIGAHPYQRSSERKGHANGFKAKKYNSQVGTLDLQIPQTRDSSFYPSVVEKGMRSERALLTAVAEMYLKGVSTRKVAKITEKLCGMNITSTQVSRITAELDEEFSSFRERALDRFPYVVFDATYLKVRHQGTVRDVAVLMAYGVNSLGLREIIGCSMGLSEAEVHWRTFLEDLNKRGLTGVKLFTADNHSGLKAALRAVFPSVPVQRCQFHMSQNAQFYAPTKALQPEIANAIRAIFQSPSLLDAKEMAKKQMASFEKSAPEWVKWLEENIEEGLVCFNFPRSHQKRIRTSNGMERVNREIKRRTRVAVLFPSMESALRVVTAVLLEIHEEWSTGRVYLDMTELKE